MTRGAAIHDRVAASILDAAADLLARGGDPPNMSEVAEAAGIARATLYRYFPSREQMLKALSDAALRETTTRLAEADLDMVPVPEGVARLVRVIAAGGNKYSALVARSDPSTIGMGKAEVTPFVEALLRRGVEDGTLREDITIAELTHVFRSLLESAARLAAERQVGVERAAALITSVFLQGAERRVQ